MKLPIVSKLSNMAVKVFIRQMASGKMSSFKFTKKYTVWWYLLWLSGPLRQSEISMHSKKVIFDSVTVEQLFYAHLGTVLCILQMMDFSSV